MLLIENSHVLSFARPRCIAVTEQDDSFQMAQRSNIRFYHWFNWQIAIWHRRIPQRYHKKSRMQLEYKCQLRKKSDEPPLTANRSVPTGGSAYGTPKNASYAAVW